MSLSLAALLLATAVAPAPGPSRASHAHARGACLGELCLDAARPSEDVLVAFFGPGHLDNDGATHCYRQEGQGVFVALSADEHQDLNREIEWIYVGSKPWFGCTQSPAPKTPFRGVATPEGLHVGDPESRVIELYGAAPNFKVTRGGARSVVTFGPCAPECGSLETRIVIIAGRVESILISELE